MTPATPNTLSENSTRPGTLLSILRATLVSFVLLTLLTGVIYPLAITGIAKVAFAHQAEGSLIDKSGAPTNDESAAIGSSLIGQTFDQAQYFWSRPSATTPMAYNASSSSGSNVGPSVISAAVQARVDALHQADGGNTLPVPVDLVTASGSGLDPHESVAAAEYQIGRIANLRHIGSEKLSALVAANTENPTIGFLGEKVVNVLRLNLALDALAPYSPPATIPTTQSTPATQAATKQ
ncbi:MAG TPA: potassium-transporting ATPase subunit KdpC [Phycisphaerae bacterium]|jgi:K+-transporting ATPase ATPase C chain